MTQPDLKKLTDIGSVDYYHNPRAANADLEGIHDEREHVARELGIATSDIHIIDEKPDVNLVTERYDAAHGEQQLVIAVGGDGTAADLVEAQHGLGRLLRYNKGNTASAPRVGVVGRGNAINLHVSLNGLIHARSFSGLLRSGDAVEGALFPVECTLPNGDTKVITSIAGFGATAIINAALESRREQLRGKSALSRFVTESAISLRESIGVDTQFSVRSDTLEEQGVLRYRVLSGIDMIVAPNIVKVGHVPISLLGTDVFAMQTRLPHDKPGRAVNAVTSALRLAGGIPIGNTFNIQPGESVAILIDKATGPVHTQFDGDPGTPIFEGDKIVLRRSTTSIPIVGSRKKMSK